VKFPALVSDAQKALGLVVGTLAPVKAGDTVLDAMCRGGYRHRRAPKPVRPDHGRDTPLRGRPHERHARGAVHSCTAYCRFLLDIQ
jgi:hypothetical protein